MDTNSLEDLFSSPQDESSPGARLYLYRLLNLLAANESLGPRSQLLSYQGARKLPARLGINTPKRLEILLNSTGLGNLKLEVASNHLVATLVPLHPETLKSHSTGSIGVGCPLEHGLIDGALELITNLPVSTSETLCLSKGDSVCAFEAVRDSSSGNIGYVPLSDCALPGARPISAADLPGGIFPNEHYTDRSGIRISSEMPIFSQPQAEAKAWFMDLCSREIVRSKRHGRQLSVLYVDLDNLRGVNAEHGRQAGDQIISAAALALSRCCRTEDYLWHNGDDEFAIVLAETGSGDAEKVARRLVTQIRSSAEFVEVAATVSASIGLSTFPVHGENLSDLFANARMALHLAKSMGKGKVQVAQGTDISNETAEEGKAGNQEKQERKREHRRESREAEHTGKDVSLDNLSAMEGSVEPGASKQSADIVQNSAFPEDRPASMVIAATSPIILAGMKEVLVDAGAFEIMDEVSDPAILPAVIEDIRPELVFFDMQMATSNDFAALRLLGAENLPCKMVVLAGDVDQDVIKVAVEYSIDGVILQDSTPEQAISGLESIYAGRRVLPEEVQAAINEFESNRRLLSELSEREVEVLRLVAEGKSNSQISEDLFITVNTVRFHLANIYQKLSVSNRTEAANYYLRQDLGPEGQTRLL